ncbi:MAG: recombinase family protein [Clostridia bacterium]|nr:recombinase family protein [Clostridia bacterium]
MGNKKASGYIRVATEDRNAIDDQKRSIENTAFKKEYELTSIYIDTGSGASLDRDGIKRLLGDASENKIDTVIVHSLDKLSTDEHHTKELLDKLASSDVGVYSVTEERFI